MAKKDTNNVTKLNQKTGSQLPSKEQLQSHRKKFDAIKTKQEKLGGEASALAKNGESVHNIHKGAFKKIGALLRMPDDKRSAWLAHFDHYRKQFELDAQLDLDLGADVKDAV